MRWVVDASIAIKWVIIEDGREEARRFLLTNDDLIAPEFLVVEVANALRTKIARGQFEAENGARALEAVQSAIGTFIPDRQLVSDAFSLAARLRHSVYDCLYLACAVRHDATMMTADTRFLDKLAPYPESARARALT
mgnify:CR=1 FL=1